MLVFRIGAIICTRKSTLLEWIERGRATGWVSSATGWVSRTKSNAEKVEEIVARSEGLASTRVEAYLQRYGVTVRPPDCIRFRRFAAGPHGALVALATDAAGAVLAVQRIYLTEDGCRRLSISSNARTRRWRARSC